MLGGDQTSSGAASFLNAERITITSSGDDSGRTFTVTGTNSVGGSQTETITGANAGAATGLKYFKTVTQISIDSGGATAGNVTAGVINKEVQNIVSTDKAFAALLKDGSVVAWGDSTDGGDISAVSGKVVMGDTNSSAVTSISASSGAFSAIKADGSVVTWGNSNLGGDSTSVDFSSTSVSSIVTLSTLCENCLFISSIDSLSPTSCLSILTVLLKTKMESLLPYNSFVILESPVRRSTSFRVIDS